MIRVQASPDIQHRAASDLGHTSRHLSGGRAPDRWAVSHTTVVARSPTAAALRRGEAVWERPAHRTVLSRERDVRSLGVVTEQLDAGYTAFFRSEFPAVVRTVYLILRDQARAEDVTQEAFIQLLERWTKVSAYERPEAWVRRVAIRLAMRGVRRDRLWILVRDRIAAPKPVAGADLDLAEAIRRLPGNQRAAIALFYYEDRPVEEVASILGCSEATVRVHLHRGRRRLAAFLGEEAEGGI